MKVRCKRGREGIDELRILKKGRDRDGWIRVWAFCLFVGIETRKEK